MALERSRVLITYDGLPVSEGGAHRIRGKDRAATWTRMLGFLGTCTTYGEPDEVRLLLAEGSRTDSKFVAAAARRSTAAFGRPTERVVIAGAVEEHEHRWTLRGSDVDGALELMQGLEPFPAHWREAPLVLAVDAIFRLRHPDTGEVFDGQEPKLYEHQRLDPSRRLGLSSIHLRLTTASTCALFLSLPFADVTPSVQGLVRRLDDALPFSLSKRHWSRWQPNAAGMRYYSRRVQVLDETLDSRAD